MSAEALSNLPSPQEPRNNIVSMEAYRRKKELVSSKPYDLFFDVRKTASLHHNLVREKGITQAAKILIPILKEDLRSIAWEAIDTDKPYEFGYQLVETPTGLDMVHDSDGYNNKDILTAIDKRIRRGTEYKQWENVKNRLVAAEEDTTFFIVSPKFDQSQEQNGDCYYPDTFLTALYKDRNGRILARQLKSAKLGTEGAADLQNSLSDQFVVDRQSHIDQIIASVGERKGFISDAELKLKLQEVSGETLVDTADMKRVKKEAEIGALKMYWAIRSGMSAEELKDLQAQIVLSMVEGQPSTRVTYDANGVASIRAACSFVRGGNTSNSLQEVLNRNSEASNAIKCPALSCGFVNLCSKDKCIKCEGSLKASPKSEES